MNNTFGGIYTNDCNYNTFSDNTVSILEGSPDGGPATEETQ